MPKSLKQQSKNLNSSVSLTIGKLELDNTYPNGEVEHFTNGLGLHVIVPKLNPIVESIANRDRFLHSGWQPTSELIALPYLWYQPRREKIHFFGDCLRVCKILTHELGFKTVFDYLLTRGWSLKKDQKKEYTLQYRKVEESLGPASEVDVQGGGERCHHVRAMVESLYKIVKGETAIDPVTKKHAVRFLEETSFRSKLNKVVQSLHQAYIVYVYPTHTLLKNGWYRYFLIAGSKSSTSTS
eukprot:scaffold53839_cov70-Attheya_sp.AAC.1